MSGKMGNGLPKMGNELPLSAAADVDSSYESMVAEAIRRELGGSRGAIKTLMRRTRASARTAKNWLSGTAGPNGVHLVELMRTSDIVFEAVLRMAGREKELSSESVARASELLRGALLLLGEES
jgi:hypothetical protein